MASAIANGILLVHTLWVTTGDCNFFSPKMATLWVYQLIHSWIIMFQSMFSMEAYGSRNHIAHIQMRHKLQDLEN